LLQKLMPDNGTKDATRRNALIVVAALALLGALGWYLAHVLSEAARLQDCLLSGRSNCAPIEAPR
jgi:hypothetical protein